MNELRRLQLAELNIMKKMIPIFELYDLTYFLIGGSLLGAVRHKGFIPWDDDIDIGMPRQDYDNLIKLVKLGKINTDLNIRHFEIDKDYKHFFIKVEDHSFPILDNSGSVSIESYAWVDIFPIDGHPSPGFYRKIFDLRLMVKRGLLMTSKFENVVLTKKNRPLYEKIIIALNRKIKLSNFFDTRKLNKNIDKQLRKNSLIEKKYFSNFMGAYKLKEIYDKTWIEELVPFQFEDTTFMGPKNYDSFLKHLYGDYMKLPEINDRGYHNIEVIGEENEKNS